MERDRQRGDPSRALGTLGPHPHPLSLPAITKVHALLLVWPLADISNKRANGRASSTLGTSALASQMACPIPSLQSEQIIALPHISNAPAACGGRPDCEWEIQESRPTREGNIPEGCVGLHIDAMEVVSKAVMGGQGQSRHTSGPPLELHALHRCSGPSPHTSNPLAREVRIA